MNPLTAYLAGVRADWSALKRAFVGGEDVIDQSQTVFGVDTDAFSPTSYGDYLATSNAVYAASSLRANLLASLPLQLFRLAANGDRDEVTSGALFDLTRKVNPHWTFGRLLRMTELGLCLWGTGYWFLERGANGRGVPREIWWARPDRVRVVPHPTEYISGFLFRADSGEDIPYRRDEVIWLPYANPLSQFNGLAPLAAARLAADVASAAMKSNRNIFANGMQTSGIINPPDGQNLTREQAEELEETFSRRMKGVDKAHRVAVMRYHTRYQQVQMTPKDAEFIEAMKWSLEDVCRAYGVPLDMLGGQRTYANLEASERIMWANTIKSEAAFLAEEITEQLLPMFTGRDRADLAAFDLSGVDVLKESENDEWKRWKEQIETNTRTRNEYRKDKGLPPVPWGDDAWIPINLVPVGGPVAKAVAAEPEPEPPTEGDIEALPDTERATVRALADVFGVKLALPETTSRQRRAVEYGSAEHERIMRQFDRRTEPWEQKVGDTTADLMRRQRRAVLDRLKASRGVRIAEEVADDPFDRPRWIRTFRQAMRPVLVSIVEDVGQQAIDEFGLGLSFDVSDPNVVRFLEGRAQRFALEVNDTTWTNLKTALAEGIEAGESIDDLANRVEAVMGDRIRSSKEVIARSEVNGASNGGTLLSWKQSGVVATKTWLSALDERTRESHVTAHGQTVGIDEDFVVGGGRGPSPGQIGKASEDISCRCTMIAGLDTEAESERAVKANGHRPAELAGVR